MDYLRKLFTAMSRSSDANNSLIATATDNGTEEVGFAVDEMSLSQVGINHICNFEGLRLNAYDDGVGVWSIGYGTTRYPNGVSVQKVTHVPLSRPRLI